MLFDVQAALAEILAGAASAQSSPASREAQPAEAPPAKVLPFAPPQERSKHSRDDADTFRHGRSAVGRPRTLMDRVVRLEEWRKLSERDRHGSDSRLFCGVCGVWVKSEDCPSVSWEGCGWGGVEAGR